MWFLDRLVMPASSEQITLLRYLLALTSIIFDSYCSVALILSSISMYFHLLGRRRENALYLRFSGDLIDLAAPRSSVIVTFGGVPLIAISLFYTQLLNAANTTVSALMTASTILFLAGFGLISIYKYALHLSRALLAFRKFAGSQQSALEQNLTVDINNLEKSTYRLWKRAGSSGVMLLWIAVYIYAGARLLAVDPGRWGVADSLFAVLFSPSTVWGFISFVSAAFVVASGAILFFFFVWEGGVSHLDAEYSGFVRRFSLVMGLIFVALQPALIFIDLWLLPEQGLSNSAFALSALALFIAFLIFQFFYLMFKDGSLNFNVYIFVGVLLLVSLGVIKDGIAFRTASRAHDQLLSARYVEMVKALTPGSTAVVVSGEEIYNTRCSACHRFDRKLVGPPYNEVLPQFIGRMDALEDFIMNPRPVLPGYPPMPNQGLKPAEVRAVAKYIMDVYLSTRKEAVKDTTKASS